MTDKVDFFRGIFSPKIDRENEVGGINLAGTGQYSSVKGA